MTRLERRHSFRFDSRGEVGAIVDAHHMANQKRRLHHDKTAEVARRPAGQLFDGRKNSRGHSLKLLALALGREQENKGPALLLP